MGVFGGSNALWRTDALRSYQFRADMQTEDIDLTTRALLSGKVSIRFEPRCRSGELPPASFRALYRQRLRWALGWDQVTLQHLSSIGTAELGCMQKCGLYYILPLRWGVLLSATLNALLTPIIAYWYFHTTGGQMGTPIETCILLSLLAFVVCCLVVGIQAVTYEPPRRWPAVLIFQISGVLYIGWQILLVVVSLTKICAGADGGWVVTKRERTGAKASALRAVSVSCQTGEDTIGPLLSERAAIGAPGAAPGSVGALIDRNFNKRKGCTPIGAAFAPIRDDADADAKVPGSLRAVSPEPYRPPASTQQQQSRGLSPAISPPWSPPGSSSGLSPPDSERHRISPPASEQSPVSERSLFGSDIASPPGSHRSRNSGNGSPTRNASRNSRSASGSPPVGGRSSSRASSSSGGGGGGGARTSAAKPWYENTSPLLMA